MSASVLVDRDLLDLTRLNLAEGDVLLVSPKTGTLSLDFCQGVAVAIMNSLKDRGASCFVIASPVPLDLNVVSAAELLAASAGRA